MSTVLRFTGAPHHRQSALNTLGTLLQSLRPELSLQVLDESRVSVELDEAALRIPLADFADWTVEGAPETPAEQEVTDRLAGAFLFAGTVVGSVLGFALLTLPKNPKVEENLWNSAAALGFGAIAAIAVAEVVRTRRPSLGRALKALRTHASVRRQRH